jgi:hypothetical protein
LSRRIFLERHRCVNVRLVEVVILLTRIVLVMPMFPVMPVSFASTTIPAALAHALSILLSGRQGNVVCRQRHSLHDGIALARKTSEAGLTSGFSIGRGQMLGSMLNKEK